MTDETMKKIDDQFAAAIDALRGKVDDRAQPFTLELLQRKIDELNERQRFVMVVCPQDEPRMQEWADRLRDECNIVEIRASAFVEAGTAFVMVHPDDLVLSNTFLSRTPVHAAPLRYRVTNIASS